MHEASFQLTASQGGWRFHQNRQTPTGQISTHSLTRRLTIAPNRMIRRTTISTHSLTRRLTSILYTSDIGSLFQLTASQGGWHIRYHGINGHTQFQLTASQGGWLNVWCIKTTQVCISTHSLTRRLTGYSFKNAYETIFQLTASQGGWPTSDASKPRKFAFQLTASQGGWHYGTLVNHVLTLFQLTASQGGWLTPSVMTSAGKIISTHSLTRRLTDNFHADGNTYAFQLTASQGGWLRYAMPYSATAHFNSQPHKEADSDSASLSSRYLYFNSQPHKEADGYLQSRITIWSISTHSLTRRLTQDVHNNIPIPLLFQLTASQGGWRTGLFYYDSTGTFQLTASQGGWQTARMESME